MDKKEIYTAIESSGMENSKAVIDAVKEFFKAGDDSEAKARKLESEMEQYKELDIADLKSSKEILEKLGGADQIQALKAKAEGYEEDKGKMEALAKELSDVKAKHQQESENFQNQLALKELENEAIPYFVDNFTSSSILMKHAINEGVVIKNDTGICFKDSDSVIPFSSGGLDKLKEHPDFKPSLITPSGGDVNGGVNGGNTGNKSGAQSLTELFASA